MPKPRLSRYRGREYTDYRTGEKKVDPLSNDVMEWRRKIWKESARRVFAKRPEFRTELLGKRIRYGSAIDVLAEEEGFILDIDEKAIYLAAGWFDLQATHRDAYLAKACSKMALNHVARSKLLAHECKEVCTDCLTKASDWLAYKVMSVAGWGPKAMSDVFGKDCLPSDQDDIDICTNEAYEEIAKHLHKKEKHQDQEQDGKGQGEGIGVDYNDGEDGEDDKAGDKKQGEGKKPSPGSGSGKNKASTTGASVSDDIHEASVDDEKLKYLDPPDVVYTEVGSFIERALASITENRSRRPDRRIGDDAQILYPFEKGRIPRLAVAVDVSGSVTGDKDARDRISSLADMVSLVAEQYGAHQVDIVWGSDSAAADPEKLMELGGLRALGANLGRFTAVDYWGRPCHHNIWEAMQTLVGGGTVGSLALRKAREVGVDACVVITDGELGDYGEMREGVYDQRVAEGEYPERENVLWVIGNRRGYSRGYKEQFAKMGIHNVVETNW